MQRIVDVCTGHVRSHRQVERRQGEGANSKRLYSSWYGGTNGSLQKKSKKVSIKEEDLDSSNIVVATDDQAVLDAAFLGFVRVAIVDPDPTVTARYKVINDRDIDNKHRRTMVESFHVRKADWEHPAHVLVDGSTLDPGCLAQSPYPVKDLKTWQWNCPPQQRIVEFLSGNHRRVASEDFTKELSDELRATEAKREAHREAQAKGGQKEITADGQLVDEVDAQLGKKIAKLTAAVKQARMWTLKAYDKGRWSRRGDKYIANTDYLTCRQDARQECGAGAVGDERTPTCEGSDGAREDTDDVMAHRRAIEEMDG